MSRIISINTDEWDKAMYEDKCVCGHELYLHGFLREAYPQLSDGKIRLRVSQCTKCGHEDGEFLCGEYRKDT